MGKLTTGLLLWVIFQGVNFPVVETGQTRYSGLYANAEPMIMENGVSVPSDFPHVEVFVNDQPDSGKIFLNKWSPVKLGNQNLRFLMVIISILYIRIRSIIRLRFNSLLNVLVESCCRSLTLADNGSMISFKIFSLRENIRFGLMEKDSVPVSILFDFLSSRKKETGKVMGLKK